MEMLFWSSFFQSPLPPLTGCTKRTDILCPCAWSSACNGGFSRLFDEFQQTQKPKIAGYMIDSEFLLQKFAYSVIRCPLVYLTYVFQSAYTSQYCYCYDFCHAAKIFVIFFCKFYFFKILYYSVIFMLLLYHTILFMSSILCLKKNPILIPHLLEIRS